MSTTTVETGVIGGIAAKFRTCPATGLKIDLAAERLIKANAVAAVVFLLIGGLFGLMVALTRWPAIQLLPSDWFYLALTAHGLDAIHDAAIESVTRGLRVGRHHTDMHAELCLGAVLQGKTASHAPRNIAKGLQLAHGFIHRVTGELVLAGNVPSGDQCTGRPQSPGFNIPL